MESSINKKNVIALSFDIEDWFTVRNMRDFCEFSDWDKEEVRVHIGLNFILDSLDKYNFKATFFVLGWIAEKMPHLVLEIANRGHEVSTHGYSHTPIDLMTPEEFRKDLRKSIDVIEKVTKKKVLGFRAPSFSVTKDTIWAIKIIQEEGLEYDSSIFKTKHPDYGINNFPTNLTNLDGLLEVPMKKGKFMGVNIPFCGGGYFRLLPYSVTRRSMKNTLKNESFVMYFHPWEFDADQPRVNMPLLKKFRHYVGLKKNNAKFEKMLSEFEFTTIENLIAIEKSNNNITNLGVSDLH